MSIVLLHYIALHVISSKDIASFFSIAPPCQRALDFAFRTETAVAPGLRSINGTFLLQTSVMNDSNISGFYEADPEIRVCARGKQFQADTETFVISIC
jgi:hypothetical protein